MITLYTSYYKDKHPERQVELDYCLWQNISNPMIDRIMLFAEDPVPFESRKITVISDKRPTYKDMFDAINTYCQNHMEISMVANTDIYFDDTLSQLHTYMNGKTCLALSRWDVKPPLEPVLHNERFSQDVWIFQGKVKPVKFASFNLGVPGCDNRIAWELNRAGYILKNPATKIKSYHYHPSDLHTYHDENRENIKFLYVPKPYLFVDVI